MASIQLTFLVSSKAEGGGVVQNYNMYIIMPLQALKLHDEKEIEYKHSKVNGREDDEGELKADLLK